MKNSSISQRDKTAYEYTREDWKRMWGLYHARKAKLSKIITLMYAEKFVPIIQYTPRRQNPANGVCLSVEKDITHA